MGHDETEQAAGEPAQRRLRLDQPRPGGVAAPDDEIRAVLAEQAWKRLERRERRGEVAVRERADRGTRDTVARHDRRPFSTIRGECDDTGARFGGRVVLQQTQGLVARPIIDEEPLESAAEPLPDHHPRRVHRGPVQSLGGEQLQRPVAAQHIDRAHLRTHVGGDQNHDPVEAFLRADRLGHDFPKPAQHDARTADCAAHCEKSQFPVAGRPAGHGPACRGGGGRVASGPRLRRRRVRIANAMS